MKNFVLAILIAVLITYSCGLIANHWFDFAIHFDDHLLGPLESVAGITLVGAIMAVIGVIVAVSIFGALMIGLVVGVLALIFAGLSVFWPMLLVIGFIIWLVRDKRQPRY
ncbi:MAG: hypothetical protein Alis3KO_15300 [Aliiglaciecola sp.]|uniref:hypothetical protein n=1 Tax=Aliiglaciecola sp. M165 TaxID=2593649 RepID=UPI00117E6151|nr:hypothetical protein [Aliiglaciecola sp. M165]TRY31519.1 hypothetical protein FM019_11655 [Aliiglaciecola sp. M165]